MAEPQIEMDDLSRFEAHETSRKLPAGWLLLFWGLIAWGAYYLWAYGLSGWTHTQDLDAPPMSSGTNVFATVLFTALATVAAVSILLAVARRKR